MQILHVRILGGMGANRNTIRVPSQGTHANKKKDMYFSKELSERGCAPKGISIHHTGAPGLNGAKQSQDTFHQNQMLSWDPHLSDSDRCESSLTFQVGGVSGPKNDSRTPTNVNHQYLTVYSRLSGMVLDICRGFV